MQQKHGGEQSALSSLTLHYANEKSGSEDEMGSYCLSDAGLTALGEGFTKLVRDVSYRPPGTQINLLNEVNICLPEKSFGLIFGRSGSGKTTLLQLIAGLTKPTSGSIYIQRYDNDGKPNQSPEQLTPERVGIVFQFPERYFITDNVLDEVTFGWPRQRGDLQLKELLAARLQRAIISVQIPNLLILDEPLAGLDWKARADVVKLLKHLKKELTLLVVSHDLRELASLVDHSWKMEMGGVLKEEPLSVQ
ncbi:hypothetical protein TEA_024232 [Camellia sinensis var. sinensis]|uniref:ABC transporter domain-containing protein n=1 Tax=Camellia sinensis var. sinensis TaxID=542762 RepID=A0A4S4DWF0_CAMSN|nr:hypothetical protein TEA_024232 [Camellia sinensis var. sinensis]